MEKNQNLGSDMVSAVGRTLAVLEALGEREDDCGVSELAQQLDLSKSTVHRFLQTLKALGYVVQDAEDRYRLSVKLFELGARALPQLELVREAEPGMRLLNDLTGETVHLGIFDEGAIVYVHKLDSRYTLRMYSRIGRRAPLYCTGIGKVLMAWRAEAEVRQILAQETFVRRTPNTLDSLAAYLTELARVRELGFAEDHEEFEANMRCLAAPIRDRFGQVVAGLSVSFPCFRFREDLKAEYVEQMLATTARISAQMGAPAHEAAVQGAQP
ncbi:DNA-binding transcriptional regulator KdgR [Pseudomonas sp. PS02302]|uniref:DNA-binding transcriptional regulator KdgR n=1 Tax=Pseudomonas sp. PS02302 TaxID=2991428 RepID=UPI00249A5ABA|nr:DNA-binding transcriptional regulator KdgR [Pseudomonas sp. PS02302]